MAVTCVTVELCFLVFLRFTLGVFPQGLVGGLGGGYLGRRMQMGSIKPGLHV